MPESAVADAVEQLWGFRAASMEYQAVGFGSHHWLAADAAGRPLFVTVDDLAAKLRKARDTTDAAFGRLAAAFATAHSRSTPPSLAFLARPLMWRRSAPRCAVRDEERPIRRRVGR